MGRLRGHADAPVHGRRLCQQARRGVPCVPFLGPGRPAGLALQRAGNPPEIVGAALYLMSDASSFTTGSILRVDGGIP